MRWHPFILAIPICGIAIVTSAAAGDRFDEEARALVTTKTGSDEAIEKSLRLGGPEALAAMGRVRKDLMDEIQQFGNQPNPDGKQWTTAVERLARFEAAMDRVGGAKYCSRSQLYWYTDFDKAAAAARESGRPILSLRLLGNLTDEYSCANSRFFRTTLYANEEISNFLRDNFVLHWKSVRPVPVVTIDFGDGRKLQRTLTGNSIHYVLTPEGHVVDALPGLYGPKAFQHHLAIAREAAQTMAGLDDDSRKETLSRYHTDRLAKLDASWGKDLESVSRSDADNGLFMSKNFPNRASIHVPQAIKATQLAMPKGSIELKLVKEVTSSRMPLDVDDEKIWNAIATLHAEDAQLDGASTALIRSENPTAMQAGRLAVTKAIVEDPLVRIVRSFQNAIALDSVKNEYRLHRQIHQWLADSSYRPPVDELNERVYAELFLTPRSDPWLGLAPPDVYTALPNAGVSRQNVPQPAPQ
jgi:hypothetical protein